MGGEKLSGLKKPKVINLFCGAGGLAKGFEDAGWEIIYALDNDEDVKPTFDRNHDCEMEKANIRDRDPPDLGLDEGELDAIIGGPPCPTFSLVGRTKINSIKGRHTARDERHDLYADFLRFVAEYWPKVFVMENVPALLSACNSEGERVGGVIREEMEELGYTVDIQSLDAADFGVPQHRERVFFIGNRLGNRLGRRNPDMGKWKTHRGPKNGEAGRAKIFENRKQPLCGKRVFTRHENPGKMKPWETVADAILDLPPVSPSGEMPPKKVNEYKTPALTEYQKWARDIPKGKNWRDVKLYNHECRGHNLRDLTIYKILGEGVGWILGDIPDEFNPYRTDIFSDKLKKQKPHEPSTTIMAHLHKDGHMFIHPREARSLTPREAARLQSFRDSFVFPVSRTHAYKQIGNAVPPLLAQAVGTALRKELLNEG